MQKTSFKAIKSATPVYVTWVDSWGLNTGWVLSEGVDFSKVTECLSAGLVVEDHPDALTITVSLHEGGEVYNPLVIPRIAITRLVELREKK